MDYYELLMAALERFIMTEDVTIWTTQVQPLLTKVVESKVRGTCRNAILRETGFFIIDTAGNEVVLRATELQALRMATTSAARRAVMKEIMASVGWTAPYVFAGIFVLSTLSDAHALGRTVSSANTHAYTAYMNKYLQYIIRTGQMGRNTMRYPPPMSYQKWLNKDPNVAWWQER